MKYARHSDGIKFFGVRLREVRKAKGFTQEQLAFKSDLELSQISRIERGIIGTGLSQVFKICDALEVNPMVLFDFSTIDNKE